MHARMKAYKVGSKFPKNGRFTDFSKSSPSLEADFFGAATETGDFFSLGAETQPPMRTVGRCKAN